MYVWAVPDGGWEVLLVTLTQGSKIEPMRLPEQRWVEAAITVNFATKTPAHTEAYDERFTLLAQRDCDRSLVRPNHSYPGPSIVRPTSAVRI